MVEKSIANSGFVYVSRFWVIYPASIHRSHHQPAVTKGLKYTWKCYLGLFRTFAVVSFAVATDTYSADGGKNRNCLFTPSPPKLYRIRQFPPVTAGYIPLPTLGPGRTPFLNGVPPCPAEKSPSTDTCSAPASKSQARPSTQPGLCHDDIPNPVPYRLP